MTDETAQVSKIEGVLSGTLSYIFNEFSNGKVQGPSFSSVVKVAREKGFTVRPSPVPNHGCGSNRKLRSRTLAMI